MCVNSSAENCVGCFGLTSLFFFFYPDELVGTLDVSLCHQGIMCESMGECGKSFNHF